MISTMPNGPTVANSSCLIALGGVGQLEVLEKLYGAILVPEAVANECGPQLPTWIQARQVQSLAQVRSLRIELGAGEAEAIALAMEMSAERIILDDKKARRIARQLGLPVTGTLAVLVRAKQGGIIPSVSTVIGALLSVNFHLSKDLIDETLRSAGE
jgi:predicted nucleic acid-binding protein